MIELDRTTTIANTIKYHYVSIYSSRFSEECQKKEKKNKYYFVIEISFSEHNSYHVVYMVRARFTNTFKNEKLIAQDKRHTCMHFVVVDRDYESFSVRTHIHTYTIVNIIKYLGLRDQLDTS